MLRSLFQPVILGGTEPALGGIDVIKGLPGLELYLHSDTLTGVQGRAITRWPDDSGHSPQRDGIGFVMGFEPTLAVAASPTGKNLVQMTGGDAGSSRALNGQITDQITGKAGYTFYVWYQLQQFNTPGTNSQCAFQNNTEQFFPIDDPGRGDGCPQHGRLMWHPNSFFFSPSVNTVGIHVGASVYDAVGNTGNWFDNGNLLQSAALAGVTQLCPVPPITHVFAADGAGNSGLAALVAAYAWFSVKHTTAQVQAVTSFLRGRYG